jgi:hypothetical protein
VKFVSPSLVIAARRKWRSEFFHDFQQPLEAHFFEVAFLSRRQQSIGAGRSITLIGETYCLNPNFAIVLVKLENNAVFVEDEMTTLWGFRSASTAMWAPAQSASKLLKSPAKINRS